MIVFEEIAPRFDWELKRWEIRAGKYFMGYISKRYIGTKEPLWSPVRKKVYSPNLHIFLNDGKGLTWGELGHYNTYKEAKEACKAHLLSYRKALK